MLAQARLKLKNAESSMAFMRDQHAKTLGGLHEEIKQLQRKNASKFCIAIKIKDNYIKSVDFVVIDL